MNKTTAPAFVVLAKRGLTDKGDYYLTICPSHDDKKQSLGVKVAEDGKLLLHCYAGCKAPAICDALEIKLEHLWPPKDYKPDATSRIVATYDYVDEQGELLYQVVRTDPKGFRQRRRVGDGWEWKLGDVRRVLYRLPELLSQPSRPVVVVEGEKDVENLRKLGILATTCSGGADGWRPEYVQSLSGRHVMVIPDNDVPGEEFAVMVATWVPNTLVFRLPGLPVKGDVSDWIAAGGTAKQLGEIARAAADTKISRTIELYKAIGGKKTSF